MTPLAVTFAGVDWQNPVVLASGTCGYGHELAEVCDLDALGGLVTKAVSVAPRHGAPAPRVGMFDGGMVNAVGLANPGMVEVKARHLPALFACVRRARVLVNVVGCAIDEFAEVITHLDDFAGPVGFDLNVCCPYVKAGGMEFGADPQALSAVVSRARAATRRPLVVKLSPALPAIADAARVAVDAGADALTLTNTMPGRVVDVARRRPMLGFGTGGMSGPALLPVGVRATWLVRKALPSVPVIGLGGVATADHALQYLLAGATLVGVGTAGMRDPRTPGRIVRGLARWCDRERTTLAECIGTLQWPT
ncbi:MAG: dihydroorotate dehydrogenase [Gemmatimonadota bacterium]